MKGREGKDVKRRERMGREGQGYNWEESEGLRERMLAVSIVIVLFTASR